MCCSDIAEAVGVSRATITGLVDGLERDRLVQRVDHPEDRRRITVALTERGAALLDDLLPGHFHTLGRLMDGLNAGERNKLCRLLERVRAGISMLPKNAP
jgi:DNA-binding MarR family transcriptional regulator